jgi:copper(I)-binding protein
MESIVMFTRTPMRLSGAFPALPLSAALLAATLLTPLAPVSAWAHGYEVGSLSIGHPWSRPTPPGAQVAAGYLTVENKGTEPDRLVSVISAIANGGEIHEMSVDENGVMKMRPLAEGITIAPGDTVSLEPGGLHLMFTRLTQPIHEGDRFKGTLTFEKAGTIEVEFAVEGLDAGVENHSGHGGGAGEGHGGH